MSCDTRTYHDLPRYTTLWYTVNVVFIESRAFTRRLLALGKESLEVLSAIQGDLLDNPERGRVVPGPGWHSQGTGSRSRTQQG